MSKSDQAGCANPFLHHAVMEVCQSFSERMIAMYCPQCAAPIDGIKFCRQCGANVSLVQQAITGQLPQPPYVPQQMSSLPPALFYPESNGIKQIMIGAAFLLLMVFTKVIWLLIPAFVLLGKGFSKMVTYRNAQQLLHQVMQGQSVQPPTMPSSVTPHFQTPPVFYAAPTSTDTNELPPLPDHPPSVVEGTTRHLEHRRQNPDQSA
jgi:hypothetical protein